MWPVFFSILVLVSIPSVCWLKGRRMGLCVVTGGGYQRLWPCHTKPEDLSSNPPLGWKALNEIIHSPDCRHSSGTPLLTPTSETVSLYSGREKAVKSKKVFCFLCDEEEKREGKRGRKSALQITCKCSLWWAVRVGAQNAVSPSGVHFALWTEERERDTIERMPMTSAPMGATMEIHRDHTHTALTYKDTTVHVCVSVCVFTIHVIWDSTASWQSHVHCAIQRWNSQTSVLYYNLEKCSEIHLFICVWILLTVCWSDNFMPLLNI